MCERSTVHSPWIAVSKWEASQNGFVDFPSVTLFHSDYIKKVLPTKEILVMYLCGADHALKVDSPFHPSSFIQHPFLPSSFIRSL